VAKRSKYQGFGTIAGVKRVLWQILQKVSERLSDETADDDQQHHWANTGIQAALAYSKIEETHILQKDLTSLESLATGNGHGPA
jgi:hypothetical protein